MKEPKSKKAYLWRFVEEHIWNHIWLLWYRPLGNTKKHPRIHKCLRGLYPIMSKINHIIFELAEIQL